MSKSQSPEGSQPLQTALFNALFTARAVGLSLQQIDANHDQPFDYVSSDSRDIQKRTLFVALQGDQFNGHDFIPDAIRKGATGVLCRKGYQNPDPELAGRAVYFHVADTLDAYRRLACEWRKNIIKNVIIVVGSVGKTSTKELIASILSGKFTRILSTTGSENGFVGIPKTLLKLRADHEIAVIEVGIDDLGAMKKHLDVVLPTACVLTGIGPEHMEKLKTLDQVAKEEMLAVEFVANTGGTAVIPWNDPWARRLCKGLQKGTRIFTYINDPEDLSGGLGMPAETKTCRHLRAEYDVTKTGEETITMRGMELNGFTINSPLLGIHNAKNLLQATAVARAFGLTETEIKSGLSRYQGLTNRSHLKKMVWRGLRVFCDYYNANPASMNAAFQVMKQLKSGTKVTTWFCLGDMLELGENENDYHKSLSISVINAGADRVLLYGPRMKHLESELTRLGFNPKNITHSLSHEQIAATLFKETKTGDLVLLKGSRGMKMEKTLDALERYIAGEPSS